MDTEIVLYEMLTTDEIEDSYLSPMISLVTYLFILYATVYKDIDDNITQFFSLLLVVYVFNSYRREFRDIIKCLHY
jgi:hypothetical protein